MTERDEMTEEHGAAYETIRRFWEIQQKVRRRGLSEKGPVVNSNKKKKKKSHL